jgi:hypothetical protein
MQNVERAGDSVVINLALRGFALLPEILLRTELVRAQALYQAKKNRKGGHNQ